MSVCLDWDDTLVDSETKEWLPGAVQALRTLSRRGCKVTIYSCRANYPGGADEITAKLRSVRANADVHTGSGKPSADFYIDDRAVRFTSWPETLSCLR